MKAHIPLTICFIVVSLNSCKKVPINATFHGRITYACDGSPVIGMRVDIYRFFDTGREDNSQVGSAVTDQNGYYQLEEKVKQEGSFRYYQLWTTGDISPKPPYFITYGQNEESYSNDDNIEINASVNSYRLVTFHIKNDQPFDSTDIFYGITAITENYWIVQDDLEGENVDTTITVAKTVSDTLIYQYHYKKMVLQI